MNPTRALVATTLAATGLLALTTPPASAQTADDRPGVDPWLGLDGDPAGLYLVDPTTGGITDMSLTLDFVHDYVRQAPLPLFGM